MLAAAFDLIPVVSRGLLAACSGSRLLSHLAASTSQQSQGSGLPFALPEHEIEDGKFVNLPTVSPSALACACLSLRADAAVVQQAMRQCSQATACSCMLTVETIVCAGLPVVTARVRSEDGTNFCIKLRRKGRTPGLLFSLPGERHILLDMEMKEAAAHVRYPASRHQMASLGRFDRLQLDGN